jgi:nucleotide-binding universal stress UspA family protein
VVTVLHAFEVPFEGKLRYAGVSEEAIEGHRADARERAMEAMRAFLDSRGLEEGSVRPDVVHGYAPQRILQIAQALGSELVVVGKHGRSPVEEVLVGSVTLHVLEYAEADVLVASAASAAARA